MKRVLLALLFFLAVLSPLSLCSFADAALQLELTAASQNSEVWQLLDQSRYTKRTFQSGDSLNITSNEKITAIYLVFDPPSPGEISLSANGQEQKTHGYLHDYIELSAPASSMVLSFSSPVTLCDIYAFSEDGVVPDFVQRWQPNEAVCDVLFLPTHADDEHLYFSGLLPIAATREDCEVQVAYMVNHNGEYYRPHELLNGLWEAGIRRYPIIPDFPDIYCDSLDYAKSVYDENEILEYQISLINSLHPNIIVGHDLNGEYGHGAHMLNAHTLTAAVEQASKMPSGWNTPKTYLHLYAENEITVDYSAPIAALGGRSALQVAKDAFACHKSQQTFFKVEDFGPYDCRRFGLYRTVVGQDTGNDIFENITTHEEQRRLDESKAKEQLERALAEDAAKEAAISAADNAARAKEMFLPEAENDFIFTFIGASDAKEILAAAAAAILLALSLALCIIWFKRKRR